MKSQENRKFSTFGSLSINELLFEAKIIIAFSNQQLYLIRGSYTDNYSKASGMAERGGFEPPVPLRIHELSRPAH